MPITIEVYEKTVVIDDKDGDLISCKMHLRSDKTKTRAYLAVTLYEDYVRRVVLVHRLVMGRMLERELLSSEQVDHIDGNPLNNRRSNLRLATSSQNVANSKRAKKNTTGFKGVSRYGERYRAQITVKGQHHSLGLHDTPEEAHQAYLEAANRFFGEFARGE